ncbi:MAG: acyl-CoA thioesterase, partial [Pseudomonadota bacterium]|nr:acyl-CoA thioesterase [Pseudomonadota bacterium]
MEWALPDPFVIDLNVLPEAIDAYQHVNNSEYLRWVEQISWAHS